MLPRHFKGKHLFFIFKMKYWGAFLDLCITFIELGTLFSVVFPYLCKDSVLKIHKISTCQPKNVWKGNKKKDG